MKLYQIYDPESGLMEDYPEIEGRNSKDALMKYLKITKRGHYKVKCSGGRNVYFKMSPFYYENGRKIKNGKNIWYELISNIK